ncbi:CmcJ/NvfI family oxidoreductase [Undibacterium arcticum]|uniref:CmcJ/NvfI family oxidoreductase n=1 Tax=Undibacterium arcticum TaxID=1762892 RepID=UPI003622CA81
MVGVYYPEVAEIALAATGASRAFVFDHLVRKREPGPPQAFGRRDGHRPGAAGRVHCDFTVASAQRRLAAELRDPNAASKVQRYSIVNLWRSIRHPVLDAPLALCDARTVAPGDLVASDIFYPMRNGEIYQVLHSARHEWSYFSAMTRDETLIFKQFDSASTQVARFTPHAAFEHPHAPADAPLRESIEIRCLLVFDY